jgi:hypothetical protein
MAYYVREDREFGRQRAQYSLPMPIAQLETAQMVSGCSLVVCRLWSARSRTLMADR